MNITKIILATLIIVSLISCKNDHEKADGYGNFEATEITISAEGTGKIIQFDVVEGQSLKNGDVIGFIDTIALTLKRDQLLANKETISSKLRSVLAQIEVLKAQLKTAQINQNRIQNLVKENAATPKQLDDINGEVRIVQQQIKSVETQNMPILNEIKGIDIQVAQVNDQLQKSKIMNPIDGIVLVKYTETNEITSFGKALYKIADLNTMQLRVYLSETQLPTIKIGQKVQVKIDNGDDLKNYEGTISWIASEAEFTPKIIQTKEERVNLVYAVKVEVKNDGSLKIGMPAEMWLAATN